MALPHELESSGDIERIVLHNYESDDADEVVQYIEEHDIPYDEGISDLTTYEGEKPPTMQVRTEGELLYFWGTEDITAAVDRLDEKQYATD